MRNSIVLIGILFIQFGSVAQSIPKIGYPYTLEIANWNLEWFGKSVPGYGPSNDSAQQATVDSVILKSEIDVWIFNEIADTTVFKEMMSRQTKYTYFISNYIQELKTAIAFDTSLFMAVSSELLDHSSYENFSTGRYPLKLKLIPRNKGIIDTLHVLALHLKANTGNDSQKLQAYYSRKRSSDWISNYLIKNLTGAWAIVAGDWNDDLDVSIFNELPSPLYACKNLSPTYKFATKRFSDNNISTTVGFDNPIDHQLVSDKLLAYCDTSQTMVWRLDQFIPYYSKNVSDHFPVISRFSLNFSKIASENNIQFNLFPNPSTGMIFFQGDKIKHIVIRDITGRICMELDTLQNFLDVTFLQNGTYFLTLNSENNTFRRVIIKQDG